MHQKFLTRSLEILETNPISQVSAEQSAEEVVTPVNSIIVLTDIPIDRTDSKIDMIAARRAKVLTSL